MSNSNPATSDFPPINDQAWRTKGRFKPAAAERAGFARDSVLIVDHIPVVRRTFTDCLSERYECREAATVLDAFKQLKQREFSVVVADVILPGLSGIELLRKVVESYPDTPVIIVTGIDRPQRAVDAMRLGAFDYLIKPCEPDVLMLVVERAIDQRNLMLSARKNKEDLEIRNAELLEANIKLKRLQAQIVHSEKMASLGQLTAGIAHELNNPLAFIYSNLDILKDTVNKLKEQVSPDFSASGAPDETMRSFLSDVTELVADCQEGAERVKDVVQNLRLFSRLDEAEPKKTNIHEGLDSTIRLLSRYFSREHIVLERDYGEVPEIDAFPGQLNQLWMNLLANAAQAINEKGGQVGIRTYLDEGSVVVEVTDNGEGIAPEHVNRIFDPFFTTKPVGEGTGLGLSISFGIVQRHGGTIDVRSDKTNGTAFTVRI
ncbi:MAG TPA: ATP-binding protein, partial [Pyrinomonadaceae bacterium]|nr:ATP-binding protein [Pyrinomonadaceae bacterium]